MFQVPSRRPGSGRRKSYGAREVGIIRRALAKNNRLTCLQLKGLYPKTIGNTFCQFRKRKMVQSWFQKVFWNQDCDVVGNLVVKIEILNFSLFVCLLVCLYLTFCQFRKRKMIQSWFQKLFWYQDCDVVSNLAVEIAIYNFDLFHTALILRICAESPRL